MFVPKELENPYVPKRWDNIGCCQKPSHSDEVFIRELAEIRYEGHKKKRERSSRI
jgi:hypothetical protein